MSKENWHIDRPFRMPVEIVPLSRPAVGSRPCHCWVNFPLVLAKGSIEGTVDPNSLTLFQETENTARQVPLQASEMLFYGGRGEVWWTVPVGEEHGSWWLYFDLLGPDGRPSPPPAVQANPGNGWPLLYNHDQPVPLEIPMAARPIPVDWDGDGLTDLLIGTNYSNTPGMPWEGIWFFRNIGSNEKPFFDRPLRLRARGARQERRQDQVQLVHAQKGFISHYYESFDLFDWYGGWDREPGLLDIITICITDPLIRVYRNTGERDPYGLPALELGQVFPLPPQLRILKSNKILVCDWDGDGRPTIIVGYNRTFDYPGVWNPGIYVCHCSSAPGQEPAFDNEPIPLRTEDGQPIPGTWAWAFDFVDWFGEGTRDLLISDRNLPYTSLRLYRNVGSPTEPVYRDEGRLEEFRFTGTSDPRWVPDGPFRGLLLSGWIDGPSLLPLQGRAAKGKLVLGTPKSFEMRPGPVSGGGYSSPVGIDWDHDRDLDLVVGCEPGFVHLLENTGTRENPVFAFKARVQADGADLRIMRQDVLHDNDSERFCGQTKVCWADWDGDGLDDLIISNNTNQPFWYRNVGTPTAPTFETARPIQVEGVTDPFAWRSRVCAIKWDAPGRPKDDTPNVPDLVATNSAGYISLFRRYRDEKTGELKLAPGVPFRYEDGALIHRGSIRTLINNLPLAEIEVCDWDGDGALDLLIATNNVINYLENVGTRAEPVFKRPKLLYLENISLHETSCHAVDLRGEGKLDLIVGGESGYVFYFDRNFIDKNILEALHKALESRQNDSR